MIVEAIALVALLALALAGPAAARRLRKRPTEIEWLRELYARDKISMLELERGIGEALALGDPPHQDRSKWEQWTRLRPQVVLIPFALIGLFAVAANVAAPRSGLTQPHRSASERKWASFANGVCGNMVPAYRAEEQLRAYDPTLTPTSKIPLDEIAEMGRAHVSIQSGAAAMIRTLGEPPSARSVAALRAFEAKIQQEREAIAEATHGRRKAYEVALREMVPPAIIARDRFAEVGATTCSKLM